MNPAATTNGGALGSSGGGGGGSGRSGRRRSSAQKQELKAQNSDLRQENEDLKNKLAQMEALMRSLAASGGISGITATNDPLAAIFGSQNNNNNNDVTDSEDFRSGEEEGYEDEDFQESGIDGGTSGAEDAARDNTHPNDVFTVEISARQLINDADGNMGLVIDGVAVNKKKRRSGKKNRKRQVGKKKTNSLHSKQRRKRKHKPRSSKGKNARKRGRSVSFMATTELPENVVHDATNEGMPIDKKTEEVKRKVLAQLIKGGVEVKPVSTTARVERLLREELAKGKKSAFYLVNLGHLVHKLHQWQRLLPRIEPHYAMKCNPDKTMVQTLQLLGIGFDCASKKELELALEVGARPDQIIFANPCKQEEHILFAKQQDVRRMTFDSKEELLKVRTYFPEAELVLRILPDDSNSLMPFGTKFGAARDEVSVLLTECKEIGANLIGVSFHVGSGCYSVDAYTDAIRLARSVFDEAEGLGFNFKFLDIGGGFPGTASAQAQYESSDSDDDYFTTGMGGQSVDNSTTISFEEIAHEIGPLIDELFPPEVRIISEPGRFFATAAATLAVNVVCRRERVRGFLKENTVGGAASGGGNTSMTQATTSQPALALPEDDGAEFNPTEQGQIEEFTKEVLYYLSDGIYGSFNNIIFDHASPQPALLTPTEEGESELPLPSLQQQPQQQQQQQQQQQLLSPPGVMESSGDSTPAALSIPSSPMIGGKPTERSCLFGPTCDSIDVICKNVELPRLNVGDWLYFVNMGAYTTASASNFNGISMPGYHYIMSLEDAS